MYERARSLFPGGALRQPTFFRPYPLYAKTANGCRIFDIDGVERIDFVNNFSALIHGHVHPHLVDVACRQVKNLTASTMSTESPHWLAGLLAERLPGVEKVCFGNSGTEAVMFAVKAARAVTGKPKIAKIEGAFHGQYDLLQHSLGSSPDTWGSEDDPKTMPIDSGTPAEVLDLLVTLSPNNVEASRTVIRRHADSLAGVIVDPVPHILMGIRLSDDYLQMLRDECTKLGIILIFDEVISLRLGMNGAQGKFSVIPDLTTMGKIIGGGFPIGALGGVSNVMTVFDPSQGTPRVFHGGTYSANPVSTGVGYAAMSMLDEQAFAKLAEHGKKLRSGLIDAISDTGFPAQVHGIGSFTGIVFMDHPYVTYRDIVSKMDADYQRRSTAFFHHMLNEGILISPQCLMYGSTVMADDDIDKTIEAGHRAFRQLSREFG